MLILGAIIVWLVVVGAAAALFGTVGGMISIFLPVAVLLVYGLIEVSEGRMTWWGEPTRKSPLYTPPRPVERPPTDRQLMFIDHLLVERDVPDLMLEFDPPATLDEASDLIDRLHDLPYRDR